MQTDSYTKVVLALILLCLVVLLAHGFASAPGSAEGSGEELGAERGNYALRVVQPRRGRPTLLRWDTITGRVWGMRNLMGKNAYWEPLNREEPAGEGPTRRDPEESAGAPRPAAAEGGEADAEAGRAGGTPE